MVLQTALCLQNGVAAIIRGASTTRLMQDIGLIGATHLVVIAAKWPPMLIVEALDTMKQSAGKSMKISDRPSLPSRWAIRPV
jgi:hypothetical protein